MTDKKSPFKSEQGHYLTKALFIENDQERMTALYTLKDQDHEIDNRVYPSLRRLFVELEDLSEYVFANNYLGGWPHWVKLRESNWLEYDEWRYELELRVKSKSLLNIQKISSDPDDQNYFQSNKFLLQDGWKPKQTGGVGRTTKAKIKQEATKMANTKNEINEDYKKFLEHKEEGSS